jgi:PKD repeat protein
VLGQKLAQPPTVLLARNLILSSHGGSLLSEVWFARFYQNRAERAASTFNYEWDTLSSSKDARIGRWSEFQSWWHTVISGGPVYAVDGHYQWNAMGDNLASFGVDYEWYATNQTAAALSADRQILFLYVGRGSLLPRDVADFLIPMGASTILKLDGGGSSGMYIPGVVGGSGRHIADCLAVVRLSLEGQFPYEGVRFSGDCVAAAQHFYERRYGIVIPPAGGDGGAANYGNPGRSIDHMLRIDDVTQNPPVHAMVVFDRTVGGGYGHVGVVAQSWGDRVVVLVHSNWNPPGGQWGSADVVDLKNYGILCYYVPDNVYNGWPPPPWDPRCQLVSYDVHAADLGWFRLVNQGEIAGTTGEARQIEAIRIWAPGRHIEYQAHVADLGWLPAVGDGEVAGTTGEGRRMEALRIRADRGTVVYWVHAADIGWMGPFRDWEVAGTVGESRRLEAVAVCVFDDEHPLPPEADFSGSPVAGVAPLSVGFTDLSTSTPTSWTWDFGDGQTSADRNPTHTYQDPGVYTVSLTVANSWGSDTETKADYITVTVPAPVANFTGTPTSGAAPLTVSFMDTSTNSPTSWAWDFGDGGTSTVQHPSHQYTSAGNYTVSLTATNAGGSDTETKADYITVTVPAPVANFTGTPTSGAAPLTVSFMDTSTNSPTSWAWHFGDGGTSTEQHPSHTYTAVGNHTVALTVSNAGGSDTETKAGYITVVGPVVAEAGPDKTIASGGSTTLQGSASGGVAPYSYSWSPTTGLNDPNVAQPTASDLPP